MAGNVARVGKKGNAYRILAGKPEGNKILDLDVGQRLV
jgi:hypothetical protein